MEGGKYCNLAHVIADDYKYRLLVAVCIVVALINIWRSFPCVNQPTACLFGGDAGSQTLMAARGFLGFRLANCASAAAFISSRCRLHSQDSQYCERSVVRFL